MAVVCSAPTAEHLRFYFADYEVARQLPCPAYSLVIRGDVTGDRPVTYQCSGSDRRDAEWRDMEPSADTVLPPLGALAQRGWAALHASALVPPAQNRALVIVGDSTAGKSTLALELLHRGWGFLSDDTTILDSARNIVPFTRPIGVRERTAQSFPWLADVLRKAPAFTTPTGITRMVRAAAFADIAAAAPWYWTAILRRAGERDFRRQTPQTFELSGDLPADVVALADQPGAGDRGMTSSASWVTLPFDFFGAKVRVRVRHADVEDLRFFYGHFMEEDECGAADLDVELECSDWPVRGFFASLLAKDGLRKTIRVRSGDGSTLLDDRTFTDWSDDPSPLPPFAYAPLVNRLAVTPAAVVRTPRGRVIMLTGPHYVGKTATALAICDCGGQLVSDSTAVFDVDSGRALAFESPLGFRRASLLTRTEMLDETDHRLTVSPDTGLVVLVSPRHVLGKRNTDGAALHAVVALRWGERVTVTVTEKRLRVPWFSRAESFDPTRILPTRTITVSTPAGSRPADIASTILEAIDGP